MADRLSKLGAPHGANTAKTRAGRGVGSGLGKTAGRGQKGQKARSTGAMGRLHFQGGQTPLQRRIPKRGFRNPFGTIVAEVNVGALDVFDDGQTIDEAALRVMGFVKGKAEKVKILGKGELTKKITVRAHAFSKGAQEKIEKAGGTVVVLTPPRTSGAVETRTPSAPPGTSGAVDKKGSAATAS
jgi:large subunit ribosomal protein L15